MTNFDEKRPLVTIFGEFSAKPTHDSGKPADKEDNFLGRKSHLILSEKCRIQNFLLIWFLHGNDHLK